MLDEFEPTHLSFKSTVNRAIHHFHIAHNTPYWLPPPPQKKKKKNALASASISLETAATTLEKLETMVMQNYES